MRRRITLGLVFALSAMIVLPLSLPAKQNGQEEATSVIEKARGLTDIRAKGSPSFHLWATVCLLNLSGGEVDGKYEEFRSSSGQWRRAFEFPDVKYLQIEVGDESKMWSATPARYDPYVIFCLKQTLALGAYLKIGKHERVVKFSRRGVAQTLMSCAELKSGKGAKRQVCFDPSTGTLLRAQSTGVARQACEYSDYAPMENRFFPRVMREIEFGKAFIEVRVNEIVPQTQFDPSLFSPPAGALNWPVCSDPEPPRHLEKPEPYYPSEARNKRISGMVLIYIVIGTDGRAYNALPVKADERSLAASTLDMITRHWLFQPATCNGIPVPFTSFVKTAFRLR